MLLMDTQTTNTKMLIILSSAKFITGYEGIVPDALLGVCSMRKLRGAGLVLVGLGMQELHTFNAKEFINDSEGNLFVHPTWVMEMGRALLTDYGNCKVL